MKKKTRSRASRLSLIIAAAAIALAVGPAYTQSSSSNAKNLSGDALIDVLQEGGFVIVMRHASSPREEPAAEEAAAGNRKGERQLDDRGRATVTAMGYAFREFRIPVGDVFSSPAFRALETAKYFGFGDLQTADELGSESSNAAWLREKVAEPPPEGENIVIITHAPNLTTAFPDEAEDIQDGEALIFRADSEGANVVARMPIEQWAVLAVK